MARIVEAIGRWRSGRLRCLEAAEVLRMSERHFRRLGSLQGRGAEGLIERRRGRVSGRRVATDRTEWLLEQYPDAILRLHGQALPRAAGGRAQVGAGTKRCCRARAWCGRRSAHRKKRPLPGMMLFQHGSSHPWLEGQAPLDLIVTLDDATSTIYSAFLVEEEGTHSSFRGWAR